MLWLVLSAHAVRNDKDRHQQHQSDRSNGHPTGKMRDGRAENSGYNCPAITHRESQEYPIVTGVRE